LILPHKIEKKLFVILQKRVLQVRQDRAGQSDWPVLSFVDQHFYKHW